MRLSTGNKAQANHNGRMETPRLKRKRGRSADNIQKATPTALVQPIERDTNISRHSGNVIRGQSEEVFVPAEG